MMRALTLYDLPLADPLSIVQPRAVIAAQVTPLKEGLILCSANVFFTLAEDCRVAADLSLVTHSRNVDVTVTGQNGDDDTEGLIFYEINGSPLVISPTTDIQTAGYFDRQLLAGINTFSLSGAFRAPIGKKSVAFLSISCPIDIQEPYAAFSAIEV